MNLVRKGNEWLQRTRTERMSDPVIYSRGTSSVRVRATVGRSNFEYNDAEGLVTHSRTRDYLVNVRDLKLDYIPCEPIAGDRITEIDGTTYEVQAVNGEPVWRWSDPQRTVYRIHTRYIGESPLQT